MRHVNYSPLGPLFQVAQIIGALFPRDGVSRNSNFWRGHASQRKYSQA